MNVFLPVQNISKRCFSGLSFFDELDWDEILHYKGTDVMDFCLNSPFIDPETKAVHHVLGLNPLSNCKAIFKLYFEELLSLLVLLFF